MEQQQLATMLAMEKQSSIIKSIKSHPKRRLIADSLNKLNDDEKLSDDVFALTMNIFDRFLGKSPLPISDHHCQLIALTCYNLAKKLRTNTSITNENEQTSWIFFMENYTEDEIFNAEQEIVETLDWDLSFVVPHDYLSLLIEEILPVDHDRGKVRLHVHVLLTLALCELNTLSILPSLLACACLKATIKGLCLLSSPQLDQTICELIDCHPKDLLHTQRLVEQLFQSCLQEILPTPARRCLAPIQTGNVRTSTSPRVK